MYYPSSGEKTCIINGIKNNLRVDGRSLNDIRENWIALSTLKQANGSSTLQISDSHIIIYCGIKLELGQPKANSPEEGIINLSLESIHRTTFLETSHKLSIEESKALHEEMKSLLLEFFIKYIDKKQLIIVPGKICWIANVDVFLLGMMDICYLDSISLTIRAAFEDLAIPKLQINFNKISEDYEIDLISNYSTNTIKFNTSNFPLICTIGENENNFVLDLTIEEYHSLDTTYLLSVKDNQILGLKKMGIGEMDAINVLKIINLAFHYFWEINASLKKYFKI